MKYKIALAQTESCSDNKINIEKADVMMQRASKEGAKLVVFPECFIAAFSAEETGENKIKAAQKIDGENVKAMQKLAAQYHLWVVFGMYETADEERNYNTTLVLDDQGEIISIYRKTHLYDAFSYHESDFNKAGDKLFEPIDTPFGKLGLMVCYELRFPEIARYQALKGAELIVVPTAWVKGNGKSEQLRVSTLCRAMENVVFVAMCDMTGDIRVGESIVADPMGAVLGELGKEEDALIVEIDTEKIAQSRKILPLLENRRPEIYN